LCQATASTDNQKPKVVSIGFANSAARKQTETTMINRKNMSDESGFFAVTAIAICVVLVVGVVGLLAPAAASPSVSTNNTTTYAGPAGWNTSFALIVIGLLISGGSGFWNVILSYLLQVKNAKKKEALK
jgi:succinate dehydrogenase hydrophobic anchor subunit